jgi:cytochrome c-type biogenesis protein
MGEVVVSGFLPLAVGIALLAGLISFLSPCVLPLIPGYLAVLGGSVSNKSPIVPTLIFVSTFTLIFASFGIAFGQLGSYLVEYQQILNRVFGILLIALGLIFAGYGNRAQLQFKLPIKTATKAQPVLLGVVFAVGWTPCIGPTLAAVQTLALTEATAAKGALLSISYGIGLGLPFLLISFAATKSISITQRLRAKQQLFIRLGSGFLILLGILLLSGIWIELMTWLQQQYASFVVPL